MVITEKTLKTKDKPVPQRVNKGLEASREGLRYNRMYTRPGVNPLDEIEYEYRRSVITEPDGTIVFEMNNVEVPKNWSQLATDIIVSKYFRKAGVGSTKGS